MSTVMERLAIEAREARMREDGWAVGYREGWKVADDRCKRLHSKALPSVEQMATALCNAEWQTMRPYAHSSDSMAPRPCTQHEKLARLVLETLAQSEGEV